MIAQQKTMLTVYIPSSKGGAHLIAQLRKLARSRDRSLNYLVVDALRRYVERAEEARGPSR